MQLVSSFELIVQPIVPPPFAPQGIDNPVSVQAYFLLISNPSLAASIINLTFIANPNSQIPSTLNGGGVIFPSDNTPNFGPVTSFITIGGPTPLVTLSIDSDSQARASFTLPAQGTALFLLQPDVSPLKNLDEKTEYFSFELRGLVYVDATPGTSLLLSPQVRGTFFKLGAEGELLAPPILQPEASNISEEEAQKLSLQVYAQQAYSFPTPGSSLYEF